MSTYNFEQMINEAYQSLEQSSSGDLLILPDIILDIGTTRLHWKNVKSYLQVIRRHPDYFMDFLKHELPSKEINWFSGSKSDGLIIHGPKQRKAEITDLARKFVNIYVVCSTCKKPDTEMNKMSSKVYEVCCIDCGATKTYVF